MIRLSLLVTLGGASLVPAAAPNPAPCTTREQALTAAEFHATLDTIAAAWNTGRGARAADCFTEQALYLEPPDRQLYRGRNALRAFFEASAPTAQADRMTWHLRAFDPERQAGLAEYTYRGRRYYHGVVVVTFEQGLIASWREYQYAAEQPWPAFIAPGP
jgi:hypothetical protein